MDPPVRIHESSCVHAVLTPEFSSSGATAVLEGFNTTPRTRVRQRISWVKLSYSFFLTVWQRMHCSYPTFQYHPQVHCGLPLLLQDIHPSETHKASTHPESLVGGNRGGYRGHRSAGFTRRFIVLTSPSSSSWRSTERSPMLNQQLLERSDLVLLRSTDSRPDRLVCDSVPLVGERLAALALPGGRHQSTSGSCWIGGASLKNSLFASICRY